MKNPKVSQAMGTCKPSCTPSFAVNPVFDPAEDGKGASANGARPSVTGTCQSPPHERLRVFLSGGDASGRPHGDLVKGIWFSW